MNLKERWQKFSKKEQLLNIASELARACYWEKSDKEKFNQSLERILEMIDLGIDDLRWQKDCYMLFVLRDEIVKFYINQQNFGIQKIYDAF